jgi:hypothetical protein
MSSAPMTYLGDTVSGPGVGGGTGAGGVVSVDGAALRTGLPPGCWAKTANAGNKQIKIKVQQKNLIFPYRSFSCQTVATALLREEHPDEIPVAGKAASGDLPFTE